MTALLSALYLAPSYLLVSAFRDTPIPMRIFVASAVLILLLVGLRVIPGRYDMAWEYLVCPPAFAAAVALIRYVRRRHEAS